MLNMLKTYRRLLSNFDWLVVGTVVTLSLIGIMTIYSATRPLGGGPHPNYYIKQMYWLVVGLAAMFAVVSFDYKWLDRGAYVLYGVCLLLLLAVALKGRTGLGATRWLSLGPLSFQPSEFFKLVYIITLARFLGTMRGTLSVRDMAIAFGAFTLVPLLLLLKQPDLGTAVVLLMIFALLLLSKGVGRKVVVVVFAVALISIPFVGNIVWDEMKDYQKKRIVAFLQPDIDPVGVSYHINQSKVAIGSGGITGKGYMKGTQGPFRFLPEKHTDFVFAVFAEEWGFIGSAVLLLIYLVLIMHGIHIATEAKDEFGRLLAMGITFMYSIYCFINIGMTVGFAPVVGIPLPFMSYGGTAMVTNFIAAGILINIRARRFELFY